MRKYIQYILVILVILFGSFVSVAKAQLTTTDTSISANGICSYSIYVEKAACEEAGGIWTPDSTTSSTTTASTTSTTGSLVPCDNSTAQPCNFNALMNMVNTIIHFILFDLALPITAIMFAFAGFELVTSGGSTEKRGTAKKVFTNAVVGFIIAMAGYLIIETILHILGYDGAWIGF